MAYGPKPKSRDEDGMTYLPIDRSRAAEKVYSATDPRETKAVGGVRVGVTARVIDDSDMPRLEATMVGQACDNIVRGEGTYASLLYLGRSRVEDLPALFEASQSPEIKVRWERLWVLSPFLCRLSRTEDGRAIILNAFTEDLGGVHLLSKFCEQNNPSVKRLFGRLHDAFLPVLLSRLHEFSQDPRRASLLSGIIGTVETSESVLRRAMPENLDEPSVQEVLSMLYVRHGVGTHKKLSATLLRERLHQWRR